MLDLGIYTKWQIGSETVEWRQLLWNQRGFIGYQCFRYSKANEIIVTPTGVSSGWRWHVKTKCIIITLNPDKFEKFAQTELGIFLSTQQLKDLPQFLDEDITQSGIQLLEALQSDRGSQVMIVYFII